MKRKILIIYTGGTIGMAKDYQTNTLHPFDFDNISSKIPELSLINAELTVYSFSTPLDSSDIAPADWVKVAQIIYDNYNEYHGFVVLHGTDTMSYTASALSFILDGLQKPVIFTGSQLPIGDLRTDAKENLISTIHYAALAQDDTPVIREVCIYFEYKLYRANRTTKMNAQHFDAFSSPNYPILGESGLHMSVQKNNLFYSDKENLQLITQFSDKVGLIKIYPGMNQDFLNQALHTPGLQAIIIEAFGSGNMFHREAFDELLREKAQSGMHIIVGTQCFAGSVELGLYSSSRVFMDVNAISAKDMTTETALVKAMFLLGNPNIFTDIRTDFGRSIRGECSSNEINFSY